MANDLLYVTLKNDIMRKIFKGTYKDGEAIPSERILANEYDMSRVTVRKALDLLESDGIVKRKLGKGTIVSLNKQSYNGSLDIIALVAPAQRRFFATFIDYFQKIADQHNSLVVFIQQSEHESIKDTIFKLLQKGIHNVVIWLDYETLKGQDIQRLRGLGMNRSEERRVGKEC
jgi:DNA-binding transcriptional regulator YhcF (GntR family)